MALRDVTPRLPLFLSRATAANGLGTGGGGSAACGLGHGWVVFTVGDGEGGDVGFPLPRGRSFLGSPRQTRVSG